MVVSKTNSNARNNVDEKKYDRQLRLWGNHGQILLQNAKICLINANATGTEILKNLILPGIGSFTIIDSEKVSEMDIGNNFFLKSGDLGKDRAEATKELLQELNADVTGDYISEDINVILASEPSFFEQFSLVICANLNHKILTKVAKDLWGKKIPLVITRAYGMIGYIRIVMETHNVIEGHVDNLPEDFRLDRPSPAITKMVDKLDLENMSAADHRDVPYLLILMFYLKIWKGNHAGAAPSNRKEREEFKKMIKDGQRKDTVEDGEVEHEENFDEALAKAFYAWRKNSIPLSVKEIFDSPECNDITSKSEPFWFLARAVKEFSLQDNDGYLPLRGSLPDMTSSTKSYTKLLSIYQEEARSDILKVSQRLHSLLRDSGMPSDCISEEEIKLFCKHASTLKSFKGSSLEQESTRKDDFELYPIEPFHWYLALRAVDIFEAKHHRYPGTEINDHESDLPSLKDCYNEVQAAMCSNREIPESYLQEIIRFGAGEMHTVSSSVGGLAAQEISKIITKQFYQLDNTLIIDTITGGGLCFKV